MAFMRALIGDLLERYSNSSMKHPHRAAIVRLYFHTYIQRRLKVFRKQNNVSQNSAKMVALGGSRTLGMQVRTITRAQKSGYFGNLVIFFS